MCAYMTSRRSSGLKVLSHAGGRISGDIRINGFPQEQKTWARVSGYVEQSDIHSPQATVEEALWFSARLRLTRDTSNKVMWAFIYEVCEGLSFRESSPACHADILPGVSARLQPT